MQALIGVVFHVGGGFAPGSSYLSCKKVRQWSWGSYWPIGGLFPWLIVSPAETDLVPSSFALIIGKTVAQPIGLTNLIGMLWVTVGISIRGSVVLVGIGNT